MKRVFTDDRFPGLEIVNEGRTTFSVVRQGRKVSSFESWEKSDGTISQACAGRRARDYFERLAEANAVPEKIVEDRQAPIRVTSMEVDRLMAQELVENNLERKQAIRHHLRTLMQQEESLAEAVVNHLIELP